MPMAQAVRRRVRPSFAKGARRTLLLRAVRGARTSAYKWPWSGLHANHPSSSQDAIGYFDLPLMRTIIIPDVMILSGRGLAVKLTEHTHGP